MSNWTILSILIIVFSILMLVIIGILSYKEMKPAFRNFKNLKARLEQKTNFYTNEVEHINNQVQKLDQELGSVQKELLLKNIHFQDFIDQQESLQNSINYLQNNAGKYSKGIANNLKNEVKSDGPKIIKIFKRALKKTIHKQKKRHTNK